MRTTVDCSSTDAHNYAGALAPMVSAWGEAFRESVPFLIAAPIPLVDGEQQRVYQGSIGVVLTSQLHAMPLTHIDGYMGDLPLGQQQIIHAPEPWDLG